MAEMKVILDVDRVRSWLRGDDEDACDYLWDELKKAVDKYDEFTGAAPPAPPLAVTSTLP